MNTAARGQRMRNSNWLHIRILVVLLALPVAEPRLFQAAECNVIDPTTLTGGGIDLMHLQHPVILRNCRDVDPVFTSLSEALSSPNKVKDNFGTLDMHIYPTGPFHLQLGSSIIPIPSSGTIDMNTAVSRLRSQTFAFGTQLGNPSAAILKHCLTRAQRGKSQVAGNTLFENYFSKFTSTIFSMSAQEAGAPFHHHSTAWLYLASGVKEWFSAPWSYPFDKETLWGEPQRIHDDPAKYKKFLDSEDLYTIHQHPGDVVIIPNAWFHATLSLANFTAGVGGQDHSRNDAIHPYPQSTKDFMDCFQRNDWSGALTAVQDLNRQGDVGLPVRKILLHLRLQNFDEARKVYEQIRRDVIESVEAGIIFQSDVDFLFGDVISAIVVEALGQHQGNNPALTKTGRFLYDWMIELSEPVNKTAHFAGGANVLLHGTCQSLRYQDDDGNSCDDYDANPSLCRTDVLCMRHNRDRHPRCDGITGKSHSESCCGCGGGRRFSDPAHVSKSGVIRGEAATASLPYRSWQKTSRKRATARQEL